MISRRKNILLEVCVMSKKIAIFTLREAFEEDDLRSILNGRVFKIKKDKETSSLSFIDATTEERLWYSTALMSRGDTDDGCILQTKSGSVFDLVNIETLIPTGSAIISCENCDTDNAIPELPILISKTHSSKPIHYGDGYERDIYVFDRSITNTEFVRYLDSVGIHPRFKQRYPYDDYDRIEGSGNMWHFITIKCYTD